MRRLTLELLALLALAAGVGCTTPFPPTVPPARPLCERPTAQRLVSTQGDTLGAFTALVPCR